MTRAVDTPVPGGGFGPVTAADIDVVIPSNRAWADVLPTLQSLARAETKPTRTWWIRTGRDEAASVRDEGPTRGEFESIGLQILSEPVPGLLAGRHRVLQVSAAAVLAYLDDDVEVSPRWLSSLVDGFLRPNVVLVGGPSVPKFIAPAPRWVTWAWPKPEPVTSPSPRSVPGDAPVRPRAAGGHRQPGPGDRWISELSLLEVRTETPIGLDPRYIWGLNFAIRRPALLRCGGFHPDCFPAELQHFQGDGETGLADKITQNRWGSVYHPDALVEHRIAASRMTLGYYLRRHFYQGVADGYTDLRAGRPVSIEIPAAWRQNIRRIRRLGSRSTLRAWLRPASDHAAADWWRRNDWRLSRARQLGRRFISRSYDGSATLRRWVHRDDYFDYQLPVIDDQDFLQPRPRL